MENRTLAMLAVASALTAASAIADAAVADAASCREITAAVIFDGGIVHRVKDLAAVAPERGGGVIRASFTPLQAGADLRARESADRLPEPGRWTTLLAGLLGVVSIARRRM